MEYIYAALLLDAAGKDISEKSISDVLSAAGFTPDDARAKAIVDSLKTVNIKEVIKEAQSAQVASAAAPSAAGAKPSSGQQESKKKEEKEEKKSDDEAASGLAGLFG